MPDAPVSPLFIEIALAFHTGPEPWRRVPPDTWDSMSSIDVRRRMRDLGFIDDHDNPTEGLRLYVDALQAVPFPVRAWAMPDPPPRFTFEPVSDSLKQYAGIQSGIQSPKSETPFDDLMAAYDQIHNDAIAEALEEVEKLQRPVCPSAFTHRDEDLIRAAYTSAYAKILALKRTRS